MFKIRTHNAISAKGLDRFQRDQYEIASEFSEPDALLIRSYKLHNEEIPTSVKAVARAGAGVNNVPVEDYTKKGIVVFNTPGANANAVKELVIAGMLMSSRDIYGGMAYSQSLTDIDHGVMNKEVEANKKRFAGSEITGKTLGVVGLGAIGSLIANVALDLGMNVVGYDPVLSVEAAWSLSSRVERMENIQSLVSRADFITLHVPVIPPTLGMINKDLLASCKDGAVFLNFAREELVDEGAMLEALDSGKLGAYVADFPAPAMLGRKNVLLLPHLGASTGEAEENCAIMAADQLMDFLENGNIFNSVNFPKTHMGRNGDHRITFTNSNVSGVLGSVLSILADAELNVLDMVNKSRNDIAYSIIDVEQHPTEAVTQAIASVEGVVNVRLV